MNTPQTDTPRTDFEESIQTQRFGVYMVKSDFARTLERENAAMREAIREVAHAMDNLIIAKRGGMQPANALIEAMTYAKAALSKLQPFLKP